MNPILPADIDKVLVRPVLSGPRSRIRGWAADAAVHQEHSGATWCWSQRPYADDDPQRERIP